MIRDFLRSLNVAEQVKFLAGLFIFILQATGATAATYYVNAANPAPTAPYSSWLTAATNIQDAVSVTSTGDTVLVTNGVYAYGGLSIESLTNRVALTNAITVQSVNGPWVTTILGAGMTNRASAVRCAWLTNGASLVGFTLTAGATLNTGITFTVESGGGVWCASTNSYVRDCVIVSNTATRFGAGIYQGTLTACLVSGNTNLSASGGAVYQSVLNNCTVVSNGCYGTVSPHAMTNCIIYYNNFQNVFMAQSTYSYCCTTPVLIGTANFTDAPNLYADGVHLANGSPCIGAGVQIGVTVDIFGNAFSNPPSVGCAEWTPATLVTTPRITLTGNPVGFSIGNFAFTGSPPFSFIWLQNGVPLSDNGHFSGSQTTNLAAVGVSLSDAGNYQVAVSNSFGMVTSAVATLVVHCVNAVGASPSAPYLTWATAATDIQDAISAAAPGDIVLVTNGIYATGGLAMTGTLTNRVVLNLPIMVMSVNGFRSTAIQGAWDPVATNGPGAVRCAWVGDGAVLAGFTVENGATSGTGTGTVDGPLASGGGIWCNSTNGIVSNCVLTNNAAYWGGGMVNGILNNSLVVANQAEYGGGALDAILNNCTVINNQSLLIGGGGMGGGGTYSTIVRNGIVLNNFAGFPPAPNNYHQNDANLYYSSCSSPLLPSNGNINATDAKFLDLYHISTASPCYGTGNPAYASGYDLDGEPWNKPPSMGCSEIVASNLVGPLTINCSALYTNIVVNRPDSFIGSIQGRAAYVNWSFGDGPVNTNFGYFSTHQWTNGGNYLVMVSAYNNDHPGGISTNLLVSVQPIVAVQMQSAGMVTNGFSFQFAGQDQVNYTILYSTNLAQPNSWQTLETIYYNLQTNIQIVDPVGTNAARFYRISAQ